MNELKKEIEKIMLGCESSLSKGFKGSTLAQIEMTRRICLKMLKIIKELETIKE